MAPQPLHRKWLHAMEDDFSIPPHVMQVARVYADFAATSKDGRVHVLWRMLRRCTHQRNDRITQSLDYLVSKGWLEAEPSKPKARKYYWLSLPDSLTTCQQEAVAGAESAPADVSRFRVA